ncbi:MAG TPA: Fur family transcriptional regulator [Candidatus Paceibacterota bacterium]|nr:Fur family transcriptional regulator [Candidatus Paceibacterota bacterium]
MDIYKSRGPEMLQIHGLSRTKGRIALLKALAGAHGPVSIELLSERLSEELSLANLYRALEAFEERGIVNRFAFGNGRAFYELAHEKPHHHHLVCEKCGKVADVPANDAPHLDALALKHAPGFTHITRHSLEFYGLCTSCA